MSNYTNLSCVCGVECNYELGNRVFDQVVHLAQFARLWAHLRECDVWVEGAEVDGRDLRAVDFLAVHAVHGEFLVSHEWGRDKPKSVRPLSLEECIRRQVMGDEPAGPRWPGAEPRRGDCLRGLGRKDLGRPGSVFAQVAWLEGPWVWVERRGRFDGDELDPLTTRVERWTRGMWRRACAHEWTVLTREEEA